MGTDPNAPITDEVFAPDVAEPSNLRSAFVVPKLSAVVKGKDKAFKPWSETAEVTSLSGGGVGFFVARACEPGRLISLIMPMPQHLRKYDYDKRLYRIWGLVQYCYEAGGVQSAGFHVGVALIGKDAPPSYSHDPNQSYRVCGMDRKGLWKVDELDRSFKKRASLRFWNSIEASIYKLDSAQQTIAAENAVTENLSEIGASVLCDLRLSVGDQIKFQTSSPPFSTLAIIRHRRIGPDDRLRIHIEFLDNAFPIYAIEAPIEEEGEH